MTLSDAALDAHYARATEILADDPELTAAMLRTDEGTLAYHFITDPKFRAAAAEVARRFFADTATRTQEVT